MTFTKTLTCTDSVHGDTDRAAAQAWHDNNQAELQVIETRLAAQEGRSSQFEATDLVCDVTAVFTDDQGSKLELHITDWDQAATIKPGMTLTVSFGDA